MYRLCFLDRTWEEKEGRGKESSWGWGCCESFAIQCIWKAPVLQFEGSNQYNKAASSEYCIFFQSNRSCHCSGVWFLNFIVTCIHFVSISFLSFLFQAYLKTILKEIGHYNTKNPHKNMWELKPEYRHYSTKSEGGAESASSWTHHYRTLDFRSKLIPLTAVAGITAQNWPI